MRSKAPLGATLVVLSSLFYASYGIWTKLMGNYFGGFTQAAIRHGIVAAVFILVAAALNQVRKVYWRRDAKWLTLSFVTSTIIPISFFYAFLHAGIGISIGLTFIGIVVGMYFFGWLFLGERLTPDKWISMVLGFVGVGLVFAPSVESAGWLALLAALAGGIATGLNVTVSKILPYNATQTAALVWILGLLANLPFIFIFGETTDVFHWDIAWVYLVLFAFASVAASWTVIRGVKLVEAGAAGILGLMEIVFGLLFGAIIFHERPGVLALIGIVVIMTAAALPYFKDYNTVRGTLEQKS